MSELPDYYRLLNVTASATQDEIRQAYKRESLKSVSPLCFLDRDLPKFAQNPSGSSCQRYPRRNKAFHRALSGVLQNPPSLVFYSAI